MLKKTKRRVFILLVAMVLAVALLWLWCRPVKIIAVHQKISSSIILVKQYPLTDKGKIEWWLKHKDVLKAKYNVPVIDENGNYKVILWDFGDGYKEEGKYDRLCFDDMDSPKSCVDKNALMIVNHYKDDITDFSAGEDIYTMDNNGKVVKRKRNW